jgi:methyl-accepting chemotaxis protein
MLSRIRLRTKLAILLGLFATGLVLTLPLNAATLHQRMVQDRVEKLKAVADTMLGYANAVEARVQSGELPRAQELPELRRVAHTMRFDNGAGYITLQTLGGIVVIHSGDPTREDKPGTAKDTSGRTLIDLMREALQNGDSATVSYLFPKPGSTDPQPKVSYLVRFRPLDAVFIAGAYVDDLDRAFHAQLLRDALVGGGVLLVVLVITWLVNRDIAGSLGRLRDSMGAIARGELDARIAGTDRRDEVGEMAAAVAVFRDNAVRMEALKAEQQEAEQRAAAEKRQSMMQLAGEFEASVGAMVGNVASAAAEMEQTASSMSEAADHTAGQASSVAAASEQASINVQSVAGAAEELSSSVQEISRQVASSSAIATRAVHESERTNALVTGLAEAAQKIGAVTRMISEIASQTNLLALNATIEAARAGEAGKGFAVVASEVKNLANQTARATDDISTQIASMQSATSDTVGAIQAIGSTIGELNDIAAAIAAAVEEQGAVTQEIARSVQEAATGTRDVSVHVAGITEAASGTGNSASLVLSGSAGLARQAEMLRQHVERFLGVVKAA